MASLETHQILKAAAKTLVFASFAASPGVFSQPEFDLAETEVQRQVVERIREIELEGGPNAANLIEPLSGLALLYEENGNHLLASTVIRRALDVVRIHHGLYSMEQASLIRRLVDSEEVIGNVNEAWNQEQELLALAERHRDDLRSARVLRESADRRMEILRRYESGEFPPEIVLGCYYHDPQESRLGAIGGGVDAPDCTSGSSRQVRRSILAEAQSFYAESINIILRNQQYSDPELPELLMDIVRSSNRFTNPGLGRRSLQYLLAYQATNSEAWLVRIGTLVLIADWDLLYSSVQGARVKESALAMYEEAYDLLTEHGVAQDLIDEIFSPESPVVLPSFAPSALVSEETAGSSEYVDVSFIVTRDGKSERIDVLDSTANVTRAAKRDLIRSIKRNRFRPMVTAGEFSDSEPLVVRYYLNY